MAKLELAVEFAGVSIGDATARIGIKIDRDAMDIETADQTLCGRRLSGKIVVGPQDEAANQRHLIDGVKHEIEGYFDVKRFAVSPKNITAGLTFPLAGLAVEELAHFAKKAGRLIVAEVADIPEDDGDDDDEAEPDWSEFDKADAEAETDEAADESDAATAAPPDWRKCKLNALPQLSTRSRNALAKACKAAGIRNLGQLAALMEKHGSWWQRELAGIGDKAAEEISEAFVDFWSAHPEYCGGADATDTDDSDVLDEEPAEAEEVA